MLFELAIELFGDSSSILVQPIKDGLVVTITDKEGKRFRFPLPEAMSRSKMRPIMVAARGRGPLPPRTVDDLELE
jgi:hypothetical protein